MPPDKKYPLHHAIIKSDVAHVDQLIKQRQAINEKGKYKETPLSRITIYAIT
jgi:ankyrin repeat protein